MSELFTPSRIHVAVGTPWKDAVISRLEPSSSYRPWPEVPDARPGDGVVVIIDSEPRLVLPDVVRVDVPGGAAQALAERNWWWLGSAVPVLRVGCGLDSLDERCTLLEGRAAAALVDALDGYRFDRDNEILFGDSSMAQAAVLLESRGRCSGCDETFDLHGPAARENVGIWTVDELRYEAPPPTGPQSLDLDDEVEDPWPPPLPVDWPAALCISCQAAMHNGGFESFLDYRFLRHPACPRCNERRTQRALFGMLSLDARIDPWRDPRGCCVTPDDWACAKCGYQW